MCLLWLWLRIARVAFRVPRAAGRRASSASSEGTSRPSGGWPRGTKFHTARVPGAHVPRLMDSVVSAVLSSLAAFCSMLVAAAAGRVPLAVLHLACVALFHARPAWPNSPCELRRKASSCVALWATFDYIIGRSYRRNFSLPSARSPLIKNRSVACRNIPSRTHASRNPSINKTPLPQCLTSPTTFAGDTQSPLVS